MLRWVSSRIQGLSELFRLIPGWHIWHPGVLPQPASNKHAKPFKGITAPTGDTFIVADISARRRFWFTRVRAEKGKQTVEAELGVHAAAEAFEEVGQRGRHTLKRTRFENSLGWYRQHGVQNAQKQKERWENRGDHKCMHSTCWLAHTGISDRLNQHHSGQFGPRMINPNWLCHHRTWWVVASALKALRSICSS